MQLHSFLSQHSYKLHDSVLFSRCQPLSGYLSTFYGNFASCMQGTFLKKGPGQKQGSQFGRWHCQPEPSQPPDFWQKDEEKQETGERPAESDQAR